MGHPNIEQRKFNFCPSLAGLDLENLINQCLECTRFFGACCLHQSYGGDLAVPNKDVCHHFQIVFIDGACSNNGREDAKAGLGITIGDDESYCWSIAVNDAADPNGPRTNQRAELLAAIEGLQLLANVNRLNAIHEAMGMGDEHHKPARRNTDEFGPTYVVVADSEYVVKGITEWLPTWRVRDWRTAAGKRPTNLDLFLKLDEVTMSLEKDGITVGFWHIPRAYNHKADRLAKLATV
ncbi:uncharacterized protein LACBIDRAFT_317996 [Laccaria bicolor S238N-H82]|uniref:ribonuclease H n=1 Tax=Laccaria bicolor (strain S238N-H82 / ATCC MYA-4686) TaxID=486041 RepID=B0D5Q1_LACBS|nr:uncharacterized protein LACBIDRAFT_317996 [Laccaria bicolor S238N-H82]EDR10059.1 predicted protein [Laccaria bicolor S238N-H82]|eukprot:XP_001879444.1 predicted protein [Laccaria bicolor S238N-H82]